MNDHPLFFAIFVIFTGAAVLATAALYARQALIVAYILLGVVVGPGGLGIVGDMALIQATAHIGIVFLLFLLGIDLRPSDLVRRLGKATMVTFATSVVFGLLGVTVGWLAGLEPIETLVVGAALMFSSTILGLKLLPTTVLHHQYMGRLMIAILLLQDVFAVGMLLMLQAYGHGGGALTGTLRILIGIPVLLAVAVVFGRYVLARLFLRFDTIREYVFLVTIGWCLGMAELGAQFGLSQEIGAFAAGVTLASSPIAEYIADSLRPLRDFFLVIFFFSLGAAFDPAVFLDVWLWSTVLAATILLAKPLVFSAAFRMTGERADLAWEMGVRLGQISEFSLLVAVMAQQTGAIGERASYLLQTATVLAFIVSSYLIVLRFPTPIAVSDRLRRD